jgi:hypothetical protein
MSNLKDTDIDDLFRRASDKYPLRTDSSDWDRMAAALEKDPPPPDDGTETDDRRRKRRFFWLFFLLPLGVGGLGYYAWHSGARTQAATTAKTSAVTNTAATGNTPDVTNTPVAANTPATANTPPAAETRAANPTAASAAATPTTPTTTSPTTADRATSATPTTGTTNRDGRSLLANAGRPTNTGRQSNTDRQTNTERQSNTGRQSKTGRQTNSANLPEADGAFVDASITTSIRTGNGKSNGTRTGNSIGNSSGTGAGNAANTPSTGNPFSTSLAQNRQDRLFYDLQREPVERNYQLNVNVVAPAAKKDSTAAKQKTSAKPKTSYLYVGLIGAPDLSNVKMQAVKEVGNTFGVLVGYAFNSHWAIETGAYLDRKKYYSEGQYFSTKEISGWQSTDTLNNVNGTCYMWEIPLNLRYTFNPGSKTRWFATAGFTTYLMTKEKYAANYRWSGWTETGNWKIDTPSQYPFSIVSVSAGFEQKLGKVGNLRIEPYLRIPLTGMGAGKLPIMSTGINIGITRQLWKK